MIARVGRPLVLALTLGTVLALGTALTVGTIGAMAGSGAGGPEAAAAAQATDPVGVATGELDDGIQILGVTEEADGRIVLDVAVPAAIGELAPVAANFGITDGGQLAEHEVDQLPADIDAVLVLDTSGSMAGPALDAARAAAQSFLATVPAETRVGLISFGETVVVHQEPTLDRSSPSAALDGLVAADGETALWDAMAAATDLVAAAPGASYVVVLSDGDDTVSSTAPPEVVDRLGARSIGLYAVAIESPDTDLVDLERVVAEVDGQFVAVGDVGRLGPLYTEIAGRLANRYQLGFQPVSSGERTVVVSVAVDGAIATAQVTIGAPAAGGDPGQGDRSSAPSPGDERALGAVPTPNLGPLGSDGALWVGLGAMFAAFTLVGLVVLVRPQTGRTWLAPAVGADRLSGVNGRLGDAADRLIARRNDDGRLEATLDAADIDVRPGEFLLLSLAGTVVISLAATAGGGAVLGIVAAALTVGVMLAVVDIRASRRRSRFNDQLTDALGIMASGLRAGLSLPRAVELVGTEAPAPSSVEFQRIVFEARLGRSLTESMQTVARRMESPDLAWVAEAVDIHRELGGNLTEILDNVAHTIRERRAVARQVEATSAEGRITGWVLLIMPILAFGFTIWRTPDNADLLLNDTSGRILLFVAVVGMGIGHLWIRKLVEPDL